MSVLEILLQPFAMAYGGIMQLRNFLYDRELRKSFHFDSCVISIGNLSVGGSGKTPMTEYLIRLLKDRYGIATLSRGYGRKTKGYRMAGENDSAMTLGDEPFQYFNKFSDIAVAVGEERVVAIPFILADRPETQVILLDDAFQHRAVKPDLQIMVSEYQRPFYNDYVLPAGRLREPRKGAARADVIVITKCPDTLSAGEMDHIRAEIARYAPEIPVFFTAVCYERPEPVTGHSLQAKAVLVTGIANPAPLAGYLQDHFEVVSHLVFPDHHNFSESDIEKIITSLGEDTMVLTTEKDLMRFRSVPGWEKLAKFPVFSVPIQVRFLIDMDKFDNIILKVAESGCS